MTENESKVINEKCNFISKLIKVKNETNIEIYQAIINLSDTMASIQLPKNTQIVINESDCFIRS
jgi:hypothetical protein